MKKVTGKVISDKMKDTVVVEVSHSFAHPMYHKRMTRTKKFHAHNTMGAKEGDVVELVETKPISKTKNWRVTKVVKPNATT